MLLAQKSALDVWSKVKLFSLYRRIAMLSKNCMMDVLEAEEIRKQGKEKLIFDCCTYYFYFISAIAI